jgi:hypothetical protein
VSGETVTPSLVVPLTFKAALAARGSRFGKSLGRFKLEIADEQFVSWRKARSPTDVLVDQGCFRKKRREKIERAVTLVMP